MDALQLAQSMVGTKEGDAKLNDYLKTGGQNLDPVDLAWCAAFVNASLEQSGYAGTGSNMARSFLDYGSSVDLANLQPGDIGVWPRGDPKGPYGHVGLVQSYDPKTGQVTLVSGNISDQVSVSPYTASNALGFRRPGGRVGDDPRRDTPSSGRSVGSELPGPKPSRQYDLPVADKSPDDPHGKVVADALADKPKKKSAGLAKALMDNPFEMAGGGYQTNLVAPAAPAALVQAGPTSMVNPQQVEQRRAALAAIMARLNSGSLS